MTHERFGKAIGHWLARMLLVVSLALGSAGAALADVRSDLNEGLPLQQVLSNALKSGMDWNDAVIALIQEGADPALVIRAALEMEADAYTVVAAAIKSGVNPETAMDAALQAEVDPATIWDAALAGDVAPELVQKALGTRVAPLEMPLSPIPTTFTERGKADGPLVSTNSGLPSSGVSPKGPGGEERPPSASPFK